MAFPTVPFALQNASHSGQLFRQAVSSLVPPGGGLATPLDCTITQTGTPSMAVLIGVGRCWIPGTQVSNVAGGSFSTQAMYYAENESAITASVASSNATNPRIDMVYVCVQDSQYSGSSNQVSPTYIATGTAVSGAHYPTNAPAIPNNALALGYITVRAASTSILNSDITNLPTAVYGTNTLPYVMHAGSAVVVVAASAIQGTTAVTFPYPFTQTPIVTASIASAVGNNSRALTTHVLNPTATGFTLELQAIDGTGMLSTYNPTVNWTAIQMTPYSAAG